jgi:hypothetical protein
VVKYEVVGVAYMEELGVDKNVQIKWILKQQGVRMETDFNCLFVGYFGRLM